MTGRTRPLAEGASPPPMSAARGVLYGAFAALLALAVCLAFVEVGLRLYSRITPNVDVEFYRYARLMKASAPGSAVGFRHTPGSHGRFFGVDVDINSRGFRDDEWGPGPKDALRVALLGDSITFGWGVSYGERFSELLECDLAARLDRPVELLNTGHGNYNTAQEYATLAESLADTPIDAVLQVWYINDAEPTPEHRDAPWYSRFYTAIFLWAKTDLIRRRVGAREDYVEYYRGLYREDAPGWDTFTDALDATGRWTAARHLPWIFAVLPEFHAFDARGPFRDVQALVRERAQAAGARVIDVTGAFRNVDPSSVWVAYNDVHPNAKGHRIIATALEDGLEQALTEGNR